MLVRGRAPPRKELLVLVLPSATKRPRFLFQHLPTFPAHVFGRPLLGRFDTTSYRGLDVVSSLSVQGYPWVCRSIP